MKDYPELQALSDDLTAGVYTMSERLILAISPDKKKVYIPMLDGKDVTVQNFMAHWVCHWTPYYGTTTPKPYTGRIAQLESMNREQAKRIAELEALSVGNILLEVVPADGMGQEVYAKSVAEVVELLTEISTNRDELSIKLDGLTVAQFAARELYEFQEATGCDTAEEYRKARDDAPKV